MQKWQSRPATQAFLLSRRRSELALVRPTTITQLCHPCSHRRAQSRVDRFRIQATRSIIYRIKMCLNFQTNVLCVAGGKSGKQDVAKRKVRRKGLIKVLRKAERLLWGCDVGYEAGTTMSDMSPFLEVVIEMPYASLYNVTPLFSSNLLSSPVSLANGCAKKYFLEQISWKCVSRTVLR